MTKFKKKGPEAIEAVQFDPHADWPECVEQWDKGKQPRDMSWGYINITGGKIHILAGDWIFKDESDNWIAMHNDLFQKIYEPA
jgi:hypothetical protein